MGRRDERGAVLPLVAVTMVVLLAVSALAVDIGVQRVARRDMQALADAVALDLARLVDGRTAQAIEAGDGGSVGLETARAASVARNGTTTVGTAPVVTAVLVSLDASGDPVRDAGGSVQVVTGGGVPEAVLVTASTTVDFAIATGSGTAGRTALGRSESNACFRLGSFAAAVDPSTAPVLERYLNDALGLHVVGYDGLADATLTLGGLAAELGAGTVEELASLENLSLHDLFVAAATVLAREGGGTADVDLLSSLAAAVDTNLHVDVADLLDLSAGGSSALGTSVNVLDLVAGAGFVANGSNFLDVPVLWNVPQFSSGAVSLQVIEAPQGACGRTGARASTAQLRLRATPTLNVPTIAGLAATSTPVTLDIDLASATGTLTGIQCGAGTADSPESVTVRVDRSLSTLTMSVPIHLTGEIKASDIVTNPLLWGLTLLLSGTKATVDLTVNLGVTVTYPPVSATATYTVPPHDYTDPEPVGGSAGVLLPTVTLDATDVTGTIAVGLVTQDLVDLTIGSDVTLDPILTDLVSKNVLGGVNDFIANVNAELVPLTTLLGIRAGGADLFGVPRPACNEPALVG